MGIQINGTTNNINAGIGSLSIEDIRELDIVGVATAANFKTGTSNVHSTGYECTNINASGIVTAASLDISGDIDFDGHTNLDNVSIAGVTTFSNNVKFDGATAGRDVTFLRSSNTLEFATNAILELGNSGSGDCRLFNNGTDTRIINGTGTLRFESDIHEFKDKDNSTQKFRIDEAGNVRVANTFDCVGVSTFRNNLFAQADLRISGEIVHLSDDDTRIQFPSNDTIAFKTAGSERLRITSDGDFYMHGNAPTHTTSSGSIFVSPPSGNPSRGILWSNTSDTHYVKLEPAVIDGLVINGYSGVAFATGSRSNSTWTERLRITSSNLQFNTTANGQAVILKSTGNYYNKLSFDSGNTSAGGELAYIDFSWDGDKVADIYAEAGSDTTNKDDGHLVFRTSPQQGNIAERLRIDSSGRVLIGSTALAGDSALQVYTSDDLHPAIRTNSASNNGYTMFGDAYKAGESQVNIGISHSSASLVLSQGCKVNISNDDAYVSSQGTYSTRPNVLRLDTDGSLSYHAREASATTPTDNAVSLTELFKIDRVGNIYQRISDRNMYFGASNQLRIGVQGNGDSNIEAVTGDLKIMDGGSVITQVRSDGLENFQHVYPAADNSKDLGKSTKRWANIYTTDLHLSNEGKSNVVDGTWGDWTLQEGEHKIFMINNRTGKKYSLKMEEE